MRTKGLLLLAVALTVLPVWVAGVTGTAVGGRAPGRVAPLTTDDPRSPGARALAVLRRWDERRALAWAAGDPPALARLYVPGSSTGARDVHDLRRWVGRGLRVIGLRQQVLSVELATRAPQRIVVVVTDRTVDGIAVGVRRRTAVPASAWATHRIVLRRVGRSWRVAEARSQPAR
jgi:hypothetical protein